MAGRVARTLTGRQFAKVHGVSHTTVQTWIAAGLVQANPDGRIPAAAGAVAVRRLRRLEAKRGATGAAAELQEQMQREQLRERKARADAREQELLRQRGLLVEIGDVQADASSACATIRTEVLSIAARTAPVVHGLVNGGATIAQVDAAISDECNRALEALNGTRFGGKGS